MILGLVTFRFCIDSFDPVRKAKQEMRSSKVAEQVGFFHQMRQKKLKIGESRTDFGQRCCVYLSSSAIVSWPSWRSCCVCVTRESKSQLVCLRWSDRREWQAGIEIETFDFGLFGFTKPDRHIFG